MTRLTHKDLRGVIAALGELYAHTELATLPELIIRLQSRLVPSDISTYNIINVAKGEFQAVHDYDGGDAEKLFPQFVAHVHEHPLAPNRPATAGGRASRTSDFISQQQFEQLAIFNEFYRHFGIRYQLASYQDCGEPFSIGFALQRLHRDFSERDRTVLGLLSPHFAQTYRNAKAFSALESRIRGVRQGLQFDNRGIIQLSPHRQIVWMTENCADWLRRYFDPPRNNLRQLPEALEKRIRKQQTELSADDPLACPQLSTVIEGPGRRLTIRWRQDSDGGMTLLLHEQVDADRQRFKEFGLTARECEVAGWVAQGKTNPEIGTILGISPRTVDRHVERILQKLNVENRAGIILKGTGRS